MISEEELKKSGYHFHDSGKHTSGKGDGLYQRWILDTEGRRAFALNFYMWKNESVASSYDGEGRVIPEFSAEARLYQDSEPRFTWQNQMGGDGSTDFDLDLMLDKKLVTVKEVEDWFMKAYVALSCVPDLHNGTE